MFKYEKYLKLTVVGRGQNLFPKHSTGKKFLYAGDFCLLSADSGHISVFRLPCRRCQMEAVNQLAAVFRLPALD